MKNKPANQAYMKNRPVNQAYIGIFSFSLTTS